MKATPSAPLRPPVLSRRDMLVDLFMLGIGLTGGADLLAGAERTARFRQAAAFWCFRSRFKNADALCAALKRIGYAGMDLVGPKQWPVLKRHGLICTMTPTHSLTNGLCDPRFHKECLTKIRAAIDATAAERWPNVIAFSGNRRGMDDETGLKNCVDALKQVAGYAEKKNVTICLELLNSKMHRDYMADSTRWCVELVRRVGSPRVKVLYDIFHAAVMGEDVIADIRNHSECWGHYHTAGVPGRHEIDDSQKLDYRAIARAIADTGFTGIVCHEFTPKRDALQSLKQAFAICNVT